MAKRGTYTKNCSFSQLLVLVQNPFYCERLLLEYMQTLVYYNPYTAIGTRIRISVNTAQNCEQNR